MNVIVKILLHHAKRSVTKADYQEIKREAEERFKQLRSENRELPKATKQHTDMGIFPAIAVYESLLRHGVKKESAVQLISEVFTNLSGTGYKFVSLWLSLFGNYHRYPAAFVKNSLRYFSPESGFEYNILEKDDPAVARFDIVRCPYHAMCQKYDCLELNRAFCDSDDAKYGNLHRNLKWKRTGTLGKGADCCDFLIADVTRCADKW